MSDLKKTGVFAKHPHQNAPSFVKAAISVKVEEAIQFLRDNANHAGYVNFDLKESKDGKLYVQHNDYQPATTDAP
tara:strand:+ start:591 stop:815 length:225 start_codon:yes stop_codon:yes gene_type:complete